GTLLLSLGAFLLLFLLVGPNSFLSCSGPLLTLPLLLLCGFGTLLLSLGAFLLLLLLVGPNSFLSRSGPLLTLPLLLLCGLGPLLLGSGAFLLLLLLILCPSVALLIGGLLGALCPFLA